MKKKPLPAPAIAPGATPELAIQAHEGTPRYGDYGHPLAAPTTPAAPAPDQRAAGGNVYDLSHEQTEL